MLPPQKKMKKIKRLFTTIIINTMLNMLLGIGAWDMAQDIAPVPEAIMAYTALIAVWAGVNSMICIYLYISSNKKES